ncbi:MAG: DUF3574 domain-containing protein [Pseudolabrys sp.]
MPSKTVLAVALALLATPALAQQSSCAPPLTQHVRIELYFGMSVHGRRPVSDREWARFVSHELTHRFPGLSVLDARGAWRKGEHELREHSKLVVVVTEDGPATRNAIAEVADAYKQRFHQTSVGIVTQPVCAAF